MDITCYRDNEVRREHRQLPASTYNAAITLLARCKDEQLFVPIRSMQYLAIIDVEEFVFVDGIRKCWIDIAWQNFQSQSRNALDESVAYDVIYYRQELAIIMSRLQSELPIALKALANKEKLNGSAKIIKFARSDSES